jgi:hypothetical protein
MNVLAKHFDAVVNHQETAELEGIISQGRVTETQFIRLLKYLTSTSTKPVETEQLDVGILRGKDRYRIEIAGRDNVVQFLKGDTRLSHITVPLRVIVKGFMQGYRSLDVDSCDMRVNLKTETEITTQRRELLRTLNNLKLRSYRLKKRYSFSTKDQFFRIDASIVRTTSVSNGESAMSSGVLTAAKTYEVEIEYVKSTAVSSTDLATAFVKHAIEMKMVMDETDTYMTPSLRESILMDIRSIFDTDHFIGPMPVTLERNNLIDSEYNNGSILNDYTVTDKADGERCLLYTSKITRGSVIKISKQGRRLVLKKVTNMAIDPNATTCIVDCEYVTSRHVTSTKSSEPTSVFMVFDAYCVDGQRIGHLPLMSVESSRLQKAQEVIGRYKVGVEHTIYVKKFYDDIFKGAQEILAMQRCGKIKHHIDGLIYTPKKLAVGALFEGDKPYYGNTWEKTFKWKPPADNSIDFLVQFVGGPMPGTSTGDGLLVQRVDLYVGADKRTNVDRIPPLEGLAILSAGFSRRDGGGYENRKFIVEPNDESVSSTIIEIDPVSKKPVCTNGEKIDHMSVVEMVRVAGKWVPIRLRPDKVQGNDIHSAMNVWRSICEPMEEDIITGSIKLNESTFLSDIDDSVYYNNTSRNNKIKAASRVMKKFHNNYVKRALVQKLALAGKCKSVFDIACGKAGDLQKYLDNGFTCIVGADKSSDNIENKVDGAYARTIDILTNYNKSALKDKVKSSTIAYFEADFGMRIDDRYMEAIEDNEKRALFKMLWMGTSPPGKNADVAVYAKYRGLIKRQFDMAVCQFAIHYFMSSPRTIASFVTNLSNVLKPNGYFAGTCLDGRLVDRAIRSAGSDEIRGMRGGRLVWSIKKLYDTLDDAAGDLNFGKKILVFMESINRPIVEYLVDFELLVSELEKKDIVPLNKEECVSLGIVSSSGTFRDMYEELQANNTELMSDEEKQYSFLNRWFVFKKRQASETIQRQQVQKKSVQNISLT